MAKWWLIISFLGVSYLSVAQSGTTSAVESNLDSLHFTTDSLASAEIESHSFDSTTVLTTADTIPSLVNAKDSIVSDSVSIPKPAEEQKKLVIGDPPDSLLIELNAPLMFNSLLFGGETLVMIDSLMEADSLMKVAQDSAAIASRNAPPPPPFIRDIGIYYDYGKLIGFLVDFEQKHEIGIRIVLGNNYFVGAEYGTAVITPLNAYRNASYEVSGSYLRFGGGIMSELTPKNNIGLGLYYGASTFGDRGMPNLDSPSGLFGSTEGSFVRENLSASWFELSFITETMMYPNIYAGMHIRFKIMVQYDEQTPLDVYTVPGYGRTFDNTLPALNLFVRYKLPF